jgi:hypothetical protein
MLESELQDDIKADSDAGHYSGKLFGRRRFSLLWKIKFIATGSLPPLRQEPHYPILPHSLGKTQIFIAFKRAEHHCGPSRCFFASII